MPPSNARGGVHRETATWQVCIQARLLLGLLGHLCPLPKRDLLIDDPQAPPVQVPAGAKVRGRFPHRALSHGLQERPEPALAAEDRSSELHPHHAGGKRNEGIWPHGSPVQLRGELAGVADAQQVSTALEKLPHRHLGSVEATVPQSQAVHVHKHLMAASCPRSSPGAVELLL
eukprot:scaffold1605_cov242-Pinguiococcus_pyrenoidosus.AAC.1